MRRQNGGRLGDVTEAGRPVLRGLEVILQIRRLGGHFCGDHGASAPPPSWWWVGSKWVGVGRVGGRGFGSGWRGGKWGGWSLVTSKDLPEQYLITYS